MTTTTSNIPPSLLPNDIFPLASACPPKDVSLNISPEGLLSLFLSDHRQLPEGFCSATFNDPMRHEDIAKEALRLTRQTLDQLTSSEDMNTACETLATKSGPSQDNIHEPKDTPPTPPPPPPCMASSQSTPAPRLNKFVRRLHDMLQSEKDSGIVEWRRGLLVLHSTDAFSKNILSKHFNTRNFKTFRRQLNYYGFVHVRSFSTTGTATTALWVNRELAQTGSDDISSVLSLRRVEPCETAKTTEGRRVRKELAIHTVEEDLGVSAKSLQMEQIRALAQRGVILAAPPLPMDIGLVSAESPYHCHNDSLLKKDIDCHTNIIMESSSDEEGAANLLLTLAKSGLCGY